MDGGGGCLASTAPEDILVIGYNMANNQDIMTKDMDMTKDNHLSAPLLNQPQLAIPPSGGKTQAQPEEGTSSKIVMSFKGADKLGKLGCCRAPSITTAFHHKEGGPWMPQVDTLHTEPFRGYFRPFTRMVSSANQQQNFNGEMLTPY